MTDCTICNEPILDGDSCKGDGDGSGQRFAHVLCYDLVRTGKSSLAALQWVRVEGLALRSIASTAAELMQRVSDRLRTYLEATRLVKVESESERINVDDFQRGRIDAFNTAINLIQRAIAGIAP